MSDDSSIDKLRRKLYARSGGPPPRKRRPLHESAYDVQEQWYHEEDRPQASVESTPAAPRMGEQYGAAGSAVRENDAFLADPRFAKTNANAMARQHITSRIVRVVFLASFAFFVVAVGIASYFFFMGRNMVSSENVDIEISGPVAVPAGEELVLQVGVVNRNPVAMELTDLVVDFPDGTRSPTNLEMVQARTRESLGTIASGARTKTTVRAVLFGEEESKQQIKLTVEYRIKDSNAIFFREVTYEVLLSSAPVTVAVDGVHELSSGQELPLTVTVTSNAAKVLPDLLLRAEYPFGYEFKEAQPAPAFSTNVWEIGDLEPGAKRTILLKGLLVGQDAEERVFRFSAGTRSEESPQELVTTFQSAAHELSLAKPFINLVLRLNDDDGTGEAVVVPGKPITGSIAWSSQLPYPIYDVEVSAVFTGTLLDRSSVRSSNGYWRSSDNTIIWTRQTEDSFVQINPDEKGALNFSFSTMSLARDTSARNPYLQITLSVKGNRQADDDDNVSEEIVASALRTIKLGSDLKITPRVAYSLGPFRNAGPYPPRADQETTFTILWDVSNTTNDVVDATVAAQLPVYVEWMDTVDPAGAISFNPVTRQILWRIGDVKAGTGSQASAQSVAFQISYTPSLAQVGSEQVLIEKQKLTGVDRFTGAVVETKHADLTTQITADPNLVNTHGRVVE